MPDHDPNLGELRSAHRPATVRMWIMAVISLGLLVSVLLGALLMLESFTSRSTPTREGAFERVSTPLICLGISSLCLALFGGFLISDFRKWSATRTVQLKIYQEGFTCENDGQIEAARWDEIKDVNFRVIETHSKYSRPTKVRVIRSIVKKDGTAINLAETLNLTKVTKLITEAKKELG